MSAVTNFAVSTNSFEGALPESGLQVLRAVSIFYVYANNIKGTIPERPPKDERGHKFRYRCKQLGGSAPGRASWLALLGVPLLLLGRSTFSTASLASLQQHYLCTHFRETVACHGQSVCRAEPQVAPDTH
eukprot:6474987-Amphidinium_carterae.1